jgi:hypothetical protein
VKEVYENLQVLLQKKYAMKNIGGIYVLPWKSQQCWLSCKVDKLNSAAVYVNGTAEGGNATTE